MVVTSLGMKSQIDSNVTIVVSMWPNSHREEGFLLAE